MTSSDSDLDFSEIDIWNPRKSNAKPKEKQTVDQIMQPSYPIQNDDILPKTSLNLQKRLDHLKGQIQTQVGIDLRLEQRREWRKNKRLMKKVSRDPAIQKALKEEMEENKETKCSSENNQDTSAESWNEVKSYLSVNSHLTGPVPHGKYGPKTELESLIDKRIDEGDYEQAELLSDHLSNREFGAKIAHAFAAKRYAENKAKEDAIQKAKKLKKLNWGFEPKERWEMKGNM